MQLTTAMVADAAHATGGKLYVLGGQWDRLNVGTFPVQHPSMAVVLVLKVEYTEALTPHILRVELMLDGQPQGVGAAGHLTTGHAPTQARGAPSFASMALPFNNIKFETPGRYEWVVTVDDEELGRLPIDVVQGTVTQMPPNVISQ